MSHVSQSSAGTIQQQPLPLAERTSETFSVDSTNGRVLRDLLGRYATGVTVVAVESSAGPIGMTVNSFSSVSLDPPLIQWAVARNAGRYQAFVNAVEFSVNVLRVEQCQLACDFSRHAQAFNPEHWVTDNGSPPRLSNALATFRCSNEEIFRGGDHSIIVGRILDGAFSNGDPLLFYKGEFGRFLPLKN